MKEKKYFALLILAIIALFLLYASIPFLAGISGAAILYVLLKPLYFNALKKTGSKTLSAVFAILLSFILIIVPLSYLAYLGLDELIYISSNTEQLQAMLQPFETMIGYDASAGVTKFLADHIQLIAAFAEGLALFGIAALVSITLNVVIMFLILYYALTENEKTIAALKQIIPFSEKNASKLMKEFSHAINVTFIGNGAASLVLGVLLAGGLAYFGVDHFFFWAVVGTLMAFIPIIGIQVIWIPAGAYYLLAGDYFAGGAILVWGAFLSYIFDGYIRQKVQRKVGEMHPLISLIGLIIGVTYFGVVGIIVGPLILTVFILTAQMFREEYLPGW